MNCTVTNFQKLGVPGTPWDLWTLRLCSSFQYTVILKQFDGLCTVTKQLLNTSMHSGTLTIEGFETSTKYITVNSKLAQSEWMRIQFSPVGKDTFAEQVSCSIPRRILPEWCGERSRRPPTIAGGTRHQFRSWTVPVAAEKTVCRLRQHCRNQCCTFFLKW